MMLRVQTQELERCIDLPARRPIHRRRELKKSARSSRAAIANWNWLSILRTCCLSTPSGKRCFCLSKGSELSSLPRLRIPGTFANGFSYRLSESISRTCKCRGIRMETDIVLADEPDLESYRATLLG